MKKGLGILFIAVVSMVLMSSSSAKKDSGIEFKDMTLTAAIELSNKTGKLIFIDCYTDWCGPCKRMAATSFKDEEVGKLYNDNFINLKIEMEKNPDGAAIARMYKIRAYPTLIMIDGKGELKNKVVGMQNVSGLKNFANSVIKK